VLIRKLVILMWVLFRDRATAGRKFAALPGPVLHKTQSNIVQVPRTPMFLNFEVDYLRNQTSKHDMEIHKIKQLQAASN
jgi:hypothetical protein